MVLPRGNVRRDFIDRCESPARCATDCDMVVSMGLLVASGKPMNLSPVSLAGFLFGYS
jgi:hypothetical protein